MTIINFRKREKTSVYDLLAEDMCPESPAKIIITMGDDGQLNIYQEHEVSEAEVFKALHVAAKMLIE